MVPETWVVRFAKTMLAFVFLSKKEKQNSIEWNVKRFLARFTVVVEGSIYSTVHCCDVTTPITVQVCRNMLASSSFTLALNT